MDFHYCFKQLDGGINGSLQLVVLPQRRKAIFYSMKLYRFFKKFLFLSLLHIFKPRS